MSGEYTPAAAIAAPSLDLLSQSGSGRLLGTGRGYSHIEHDLGVLSITGPGVALMPNGIGIGLDPSSLMGALDTVCRWEPGILRVGSAAITWDPSRPPLWNPAIPPQARAGSIAGIRARAGTFLNRLGVDNSLVVEVARRPSSHALRRLAHGVLSPPVAESFPSFIRSAVATGSLCVDRGHGLIGNGPGLTPEGDDLIVGVLSTLSVFGSRDGVSIHETWSKRGPALQGIDDRTTPLSATLLRLAANGMVVEPVSSLFGIRSSRCLAAFERLLAIGNSTGRAYVLGISTTAIMARWGFHP